MYLDLKLEKMPNNEPVRDKIEMIIKLNKETNKSILAIDMSSYFKLKDEIGYVEEEILNYAGFIIHVIPTSEEHIELL